MIITSARRGGTRQTAIADPLPRRCVREPVPPPMTGGVQKATFSRYGDCCRNSIEPHRACLRPALTGSPLHGGVAISVVRIARGAVPGVEHYRTFKCSTPQKTCQIVWVSSRRRRWGDPSRANPLLLPFPSPAEIAKTRLRNSITWY